MGLHPYVQIGLQATFSLEVYVCVFQNIDLPMINWMAESFMKIWGSKFLYKKMAFEILSIAEVVSIASTSQNESIMLCPLNNKYTLLHSGLFIVHLWNFKLLFLLSRSVIILTVMCKYIHSSISFRLKYQMALCGASQLSSETAISYTGVEM